MRELIEHEIEGISTGKKWLSIVTEAVFGGLVEGFIGLAVAGPVGFVAGFGKGVYEGAAVAVVYEHTISLINPNSSAYKAGLRNGQVVKYHSISLINADRNMSVWVEIDGKIQEISFMPDRKLERLLQYKFIEVNSRGFLSNILSKIFKA